PRAARVLAAQRCQPVALAQPLPGLRGGRARRHGPVRRLRTRAAPQRRRVPAVVLAPAGGPFGLRVRGAPGPPLAAFQIPRRPRGRASVVATDERILRRVAPARCPRAGTAAPGPPALARLRPGAGTGAP